ncbi:MAG: hypothetical protein IKB91_09105 [Anaerotignum sp.]|nr:hypothetical protein [Anaerotignum sp.]
MKEQKGAGAETTSAPVDADSDGITDAYAAEGYYTMDGNKVNETILTDVMMDTDDDGVIDID